MYLLKFKFMVQLTCEHLLKLLSPTISLSFQYWLHNSVHTWVSFHCSSQSCNLADNIYACLKTAALLHPSAEYSQSVAVEIPAITVPEKQGQHQINRESSSQTMLYLYCPKQKYWYKYISFFWTFLLINSTQANSKFPKLQILLCIVVCFIVFVLKVLHTKWEISRHHGSCFRPKCFTPSRK